MWFKILVTMLDHTKTSFIVCNGSFNTENLRIAGQHENSQILKQFYD